MVFSSLLVANQVNTDRKKLEQYLKKARISGLKSSVTRTIAYFVDLDDGNIKRRGFLKFTDNRRPNFVSDSFAYGLAAYEMDKLLDLNIIPPNVEREVDGQKASLMLLVDREMDEGGRRLRKIEPPDPEKFFNTLEVIKVFEYLVYSTSLCIESDLEDVLITPQWKVWRVDFSEAFEPSPGLIQGCEITRCSRKFYQNLVSLKDKEIKSKMKKYLNKEEINALLKRKKLIIETIRKLIEEKGEKAVLF
jgi:hypothetical protein